MLASETPRWNDLGLSIKLAVSWIIVSSMSAGVFLAAGVRHSSPYSSLFFPLGCFWLLSPILSGVRLAKKYRPSLESTNSLP
jgi:hypothetical protein